ncbi:LysR family transcriptional regulator [Massilia putida]|uniref:LysR family transcriptional regulator n=1 Tax=Massilia putida TaxID=1141883 RepID=UPI000951AC89|nr:LysR family transcriptional regulator [Massilia putida]
MDLKRLKTFVRVAGTLNISEAARQIHRTQSSVTEQIQALEADLGVALFDRSNRKLALTAAGTCLLDHATRLIELADAARAAVRAAGGNAAQALTVGGIETIAAAFLPDVVARMAATHPHVSVRVAVAATSALHAGVRDGTLDAACFFGTLAPEDGLACSVIAHAPLVLVVPPGHPLAGRTGANHDDIAHERFLVTARGCAYRRMFEAALRAQPERQPRIAGEFDSVAAIVGLVERGLGCAIVPRMVPALADARVAIVPWHGAAATVPVSVAWRERPSAAVAALLAALPAAPSGATPADGRHRYAAPPP